MGRRIVRRLSPRQKIRTIPGKRRGDEHPRIRFPPPIPTPMNVIALTILVSSCLAGIFILCFVGELRRSRNSSPERDSLLPLDDDKPSL